MCAIVLRIHPPIHTRWYARFCPSRCAVDARILRGMPVTLVRGHSATCTPAAARGEHSQQDGAFTREAPAGRIVRTREASIPLRLVKGSWILYSTVCCVSHTLKECVGYHTPISNLGPVSPQNRANGHFRSKPSRDSHIFSRKNPVKPLEYCQKRHISDLFFSIFPPVRELFFPPKMNVTPHF